MFPAACIASPVSVTGYIQTPLISSTQFIQIPPGTKRIEVLLCGAGGGGGCGNPDGAGGGGGGYIGIFAIPLIPGPLLITIGAGGGSTNSTGTSGGVGGDSTVSYGAVVYARAGGGGGGGSGAGAELPVRRARPLAIVAVAAGPGPITCCGSRGNCWGIWMAMWLVPI